MPTARLRQPFAFPGMSFVCRHNQLVGYVDIDETFRVEFDLVVHGKKTEYYGSILHIGNDDKERIPGIWLQPNSLRLHVRMSDEADYNQGYDPHEELVPDKKYTVKIEGDEETVKYYLIEGDEKTVTFYLVKRGHMQRDNRPVYVGDPWYEPADATVSNLKIS